MNKLHLLAVLMTAISLHAADPLPPADNGPQTDWAAFGPYFAAINKAPDAKATPVDATAIIARFVRSWTASTYARFAADSDFHVVASWQPGSVTVPDGAIAAPLPADDLGMRGYVLPLVIRGKFLGRVIDQRIPAEVYISQVGAGDPDVQRDGILCLVSVRVVPTGVLVVDRIIPIDRR